MPPAARVSDMHVCPMVTGVVPHVGGPILPPCSPTVLIGFLPAARITDQAVCVGPPDIIVKGSPTVLINNLMAARVGDITAHGGNIILGCFTVIIGEVGMGVPPTPGIAAPNAPAPTTAPGQGGGSSGPPSPPGKAAGEVQAASKKYDIKPSMNEILRDARVDAELKKAWKESNPNAPEVPSGQPGSTKKEQGGWIVWNKKSGQLEVRRVPGGDRDGLGPIVGTRPPDNQDQQVVAWFHTHPNTSNEGYQHGPSPGDVAWQNSEAKVPGIIETHEGRKTIPYP